ncbi:hypothetical protein NECAME_07704 [Necator americanus]|uniref:Uncharacterized protein n=1 Tax=Necator americanus TaxID=51031 RepID=W2TP17_NECAM|nr:hypothetical protein NECAME_07704 [Necator americanus]ETN82871.1 hypothetical protein NECAME_07704 [Necator americanus]
MFGNTRNPYLDDPVPDAGNGHYSSTQNITIAMGEDSWITNCGPPFKHTEVINRGACVAERAPAPTTSSSLTWETRIQCFIGCFLLSIISSFCASTNRTYQIV